MSDWLEEQLRHTMATLKQQRDRIEAAKDELAARTASATSKDHMVTVTMDAQGAVVSLEFHTTKYRSMHPKELAAALVDVLGRARQEMADAAVETFGDLMDQRTELRAAMTGSTEVDSLFASIWDDRPAPDLHRRG